MECLRHHHGNSQSKNPAPVSTPSRKRICGPSWISCLFFLFYTLYLSLLLTLFSKHCPNKSPFLTKKTSLPKPLNNISLFIDKVKLSYPHYSPFLPYSITTLFLPPNQCSISCWASDGVSDACRMFITARFSELATAGESLE